ncbi:POK7 protein, partial [Notiomystis cincta]|nr:POK7 protein [Notiomystis cincta]
THFLQAFAVLGKPLQIKTDNAPAYKGHCATAFFKLWGITHITGVPYNSTGQAIIERRHRD